MELETMDRVPGILSMGLLVDTVQQLSLARDIDSVMRIVRTVARKLTGADGATFVLRDNEYCYYADEDAISPLWKGSRFPMKICISGWAMLNKRSVVIEDIYADDRIPADAYRPTFVKSLAMVPIRTIDPIGAIGTYWAHHYRPTREEVALLQSLADITAVSIENINVRNTLEEKVVERTHELTASLEREQKLGETKSALLSMASHEFRTPLTTILSSLSLAEQYGDTEQRDKRQRHYNRIRSSVKALLDIQDAFLSVDRLEQGRIVVTKEQFNLHELLIDIIEDLDAIRKPEQTIRLSFSGDNIVKLDSKVLSHVLLNLLSNAIKYSEKDIELSAEVKNGQINIQVQDQGIGIPADQQKNIFGKFFRASNAIALQGTGLGLNIVKHYINLLHGAISFESQEGRGTSFYITLPSQATDC